MDVWVNFTNATKWQAEGIFKCFFPTRTAKEKAESASQSSPSSEKGDDAVTRNVPGVKRKQYVHTVPVLEEEEINELAKRFAEQIPEDEMSVRTFHAYAGRKKQCIEIYLLSFLSILERGCACIYRSQACRVISSRTRHVLVNVLMKLPNGRSPGTRPQISPSIRRDRILISIICFF